MNYSLQGNSSSLDFSHLIFQSLAVLSEIMGFMGCSQRMILDPRIQKSRLPFYLSFPKFVTKLRLCGQ